MNETLELFKDFGFSASYHYADDSTKEWHLGDKDKRKAMKLYYANPHLQKEMKEIAKEFLWSLKFERGVNETGQ